jgi:hypothetical protein
LFIPNPLSRRLWLRWLPQALAVLLVVTQIQAAEQAAAPQTPAVTPQAGTLPTPANPTPAQPVPQLPVEQSLKIRVLAGNGEMNDLERRVMAPLVIQVLDQNERPLAGAEVVVRFPLNGPSATFAGGKSAITIRTRGDGQAAATNWMANGVGTFQVHVNATYGNQVGETTVSMTNVTRIVDTGKSAKHETLWSHRWFKIAVIGGAAVAIGLGVYFGTRGGSKSGSGSTVTITPGSPGIGAPQ